MRKTIFALGATVCILAAEAFSIAAAIAFAIFQLVLLVGVREGKSYTVYRYDFGRQERETVGRVSERRKRERGNNYLDLLRRARTLYPTPSMNSLILISPD
ncbi:MAG: hypothetical protein FIA93_07935 [Deltaproteobacteria bacterium]|nr:hypothetical protein [Deltaproteobacteria bacterium]PWB67751.1 MAG: hypothetical protein C3F14_01275 [Deltaproteobacteria bacterium]